MTLPPRRSTLTADGVAIRPLGARDTTEYAQLVVDNRAHTAPWDPLRPDWWYTRAGQEDQLRRDEDAWQAGTGYAFGVLDRADDRLVGRVALGNVVRGPWQNATLGYWIAAAACGRGVGTGAVLLALEFAFEHAGLHRVQPAIIPRNAGSIRLVEKCGFRLEGRALRYLQIAGVWEDHDIYAMTAEDWAARGD